MISSAGDQCCSKAQILLVDDDEFNLFPLVQILEYQLNLVCDSVTSGEEVIKLFEADRQKTCCTVRYKLILSDIAMPVIDGI